MAPPAAAAAVDLNAREYSAAQREAALKIQGHWARVRQSVIRSPGEGKITTMAAAVRAAKRAEQKRKLAEWISQ